MAKRKPRSQNDDILRHLKTHKGITSFTAFERYGVTRISARIFDLRERGYNIINVDKEAVDRRGKKTRFVEYRLVKEAQA